MDHYKDFAYFVGMILMFFGTNFYDKWKKRREIKQKPLLLDKYAATREEINSYLFKILSYTGCARVSIYEYSNGTYTHSNTSLQFIECTYEVTDESTKPIINQFKRVPISTYLKMITMIGESSLGWLRMTDKSDDTELNKQQKYWKATTNYNFKITKVVWDGVISLTWINEYKEMTPEQISNVEIIIMRINSLMSKLVIKN